MLSTDIHWPADVQAKSAFGNMFMYPVNMISNNVTIDFEFKIKSK